MGYLILACWVCAGGCAALGATLQAGLGYGFGVAAIWFFVTTVVLAILRRPM